jgi:hypothetical protein
MTRLVISAILIPDDEPSGRNIWMVCGRCMLFVVSDVIASAKAAKESEMEYCLKIWYLCTDFIYVSKPFLIC